MTRSFSNIVWAPPRSAAKVTLSGPGNYLVRRALVICMPIDADTASTSRAPPGCLLPFIICHSPRANYALCLQLSASAPGGCTVNHVWGTSWRARARRCWTSAIRLTSWFYLLVVPDGSRNETSSRPPSFLFCHGSEMRHIK